VSGASTGRGPVPGPLGLWLTVLGPAALEAVPTEGLDWIGVDLQHGPYEVVDLPGLARATSLPLLARAASQDPAHLARVLDTGVAGVIVPGVDDGDQAAALVAAVRFPPQGRRSTGLSRGALVGAPDRPLLLPMVETREGLAAVQEIAGCPGVDGVFVGPYDLSLSLGRDSVLDQEVVTAVATVARAARRHRVLVGAFAGDRRLQPLLPALDLLALDTDVTALRAGIRHLLRPVQQP
jgi:4-hydroxy-2-oxoheptanedioate aldolase